MRISHRRSLVLSALFGSFVSTGCSPNGLDGMVDLGPDVPDAAPVVVPEGEPEFVIGPMVPVKSGLQDGTGPSANYINLGNVVPTNPVRMLIGFPLRNQDGLEQYLRELYDPKSPNFRRYLSQSDFMAKYGPYKSYTDGVVAWLISQGLTVPYKASNRLMITVHGTAEQFNKAFSTTLIKWDAAGSSGNTIYYGATIPPQAPQGVADSISGLLVAMPAAAVVALAPEKGKVSTDPPSKGKTLSAIKQAYKVDDLAGFTGQGMKIGVVAGGAIRSTDVQSFWQGQGIVRSSPMVRPVLGPPNNYNTEATLDAQWAGGLAPSAELILYQGEDYYDASVAYLFNEAIGAGEVQVVTTSFAHIEQFRHPLLRVQHDLSGMMAAALGITVMSASGDSAVGDLPATCPYVTAVGGTVLSGTSSESAWLWSGSGTSKSFPLPWYQAGLGLEMKTPLRATVDVALNSKGMAYYFGGSWYDDDGTSFASPAFAGMIAVINSARAARGLPGVGFLNSLLYTTKEVQQSFRDISTGKTDQFSAGPGWDYPTGWGSPNAAALDRTLP